MDTTRSQPPLRRMVGSVAPRVGFLATASSPKPPWTPKPPTRPPEVPRCILNAPHYPSASSSRSLSAPRSRKSTRAALIVAVPLPPTSNVCVADQTFYKSNEEDVSLHTCLNATATRHSLQAETPLPVPLPHTVDVSLAAPQHQPISNARPEIDDYQQFSSSYLPQQDSFPQLTPFDDDDFSTIIPFNDTRSHDEYSMYDDFLSSSLSAGSSTNFVSNTVPHTTDPFIESAAVPARAFSHEEDILANVDVGDFEKEVDIGQWMKYLQEDSDQFGIPGVEENIFERVESEPTTPEMMVVAEGLRRDDYFAVPTMPNGSGGYGRQMRAQTDLDPVQEFFPEMCVEVSQTIGYETGMSAACPEWQTYQQYSPSHTPASIVSDISSSSTSWSETTRTVSRKRQAQSPIFDDDYRCKRDKNNKASQISRQKHKDKIESQKVEVVELARRNDALKLEVDTLEQQIATMRAVLMDSIGNAAQK